MTKATETLNKVKTLLGLQVALESAKLDNGTVIEAESFEAGNEVFIVSADEKVALPVGEYSMEDGKELVVTEEGLIAEIKEATNEEEAPAEEEAPIEEELEAETTETPKKVVNTISEEVHFSQEDVDVLNATISELRAELTELKSANEEEAPAKEEEAVELSSDEVETKLFSHNPTKKLNNTNTNSKKALSKSELIWNTINNI